MWKIKANVIAFQTPIIKVYNILPPPCAEMNEVLAILFTGLCKLTESDLSCTPFQFNAAMLLKLWTCSN